MSAIEPTRTWEDNAAEFGRLTAERDARYGWPLAILVACSVEPGTGTGGNPSVARATDAGKVSAREFAGRAGVSRDTVLRYLDRWALAIENGAPVPPAAELTPGDVAEIGIPDRPFNGQGGFVTTGNLQGKGADTRDAAAGRSPESLAEALKAATQETIEAATDRLPREHVAKVRMATGRSALRTSEAEAVANGGRIYPREHYEPGPSAASAVRDMLKDWDAIERTAADLLAKLNAYGPALGDHADQVRGWSLALLDHLDLTPAAS